MSLTSVLGKNKYFNGPTDNFDIFERSLKIWGSNENPHLELLLDGSFPFDVFEFKGTRMKTLKFDEMVEVVEKLHEDGKSIGDYMDPEQKEDATKEVQKKLQGYGDQLCRKLHTVIEKSITKNVKTSLENLGIKTGDGLTTWKKMCLRYRASNITEHMKIFFDMLKMEGRSYKSIDALNQAFNSKYKSLVASLSKDEEEKVKGLPQSILCGMYLNTLPSEFNFIVRLNMREAEKDLKKIQEGVDRYAISEEIKLNKCKGGNGSALFGGRFGPSKTTTTPPTKDPPKKPRGDRPRKLKCYNCGKVGHKSDKCRSKCKVCGKKNCHAMKHKDQKDRGSARNAEDDNDPKIERMIAAAVQKYISRNEDNSGLGLTATSPQVSGKASRGSNKTKKWRKVLHKSPIWDSGADKDYFPVKDLPRSQNREKIRETVVTAAGSTHEITTKGEIGDHKNIRFV